MINLTRISTFSNLLLYLLIGLISSELCYSKHVKSKGQHVKRIVRETLFIQEDTIWTDGNPRPKSVLINGTMPGPTLRFKVGDLAIIKVYNSLKKQNTTIHFHGLSQSLLPSSDGTSMISQWPIATGNYFEYELFFTNDQVGSTFYHSHIGAQILTCFGALIVEEDDDEINQLQHISEIIMTIGDYFYSSNDQIVKNLLGTPFVWPGSAQSISLNGKSWPSIGGCNLTIAEMAGTSCDQSTYKGPEVIDVQYDHTYKLRWIGAQTLMHLAVGIFNHSQTIIAADGSYIEPIEISYFEIMAGQRYDTIIKTKSKQEVENDNQGGCYPIRFETRWRKPQTNGWSMLRYAGGNCDVSPQAEYPLNNTINYLPEGKDFWISNQLHPLQNSIKSLQVPSDLEVTRRVFLESQQIPFSDATSNYPIRWDINNQIFNETIPKIQGNTIPLKKPYLIELYEGLKPMPNYERGMNPPNGVQIGFDKLTNTYVGKAGEVIDIIIINNSSAVNKQTETHPWHFHGQKHWTIAMGLGDFTESAFEESKKQFYPAIARDTSGVWPGLGASISNSTIPLNSSGAWTVIRYKIPKNRSSSGMWMFHCHWAFHLIMGMSTTWFFGPFDKNQIQNHYSDPNYLFFGKNVTANTSLQFSKLS